MSKLIGKPFKCTPEKFASTIRVGKTVRIRYGVCECDCGTIYVSTLLKVKGTARTYRPAAKECSHCNGRTGEESRVGDWEFKLRERIIRHQRWYQDRTGSQRCDHCHKRRAHGVIGSYDKKLNYEYLCRECNAVYHLRPPAVETNVAGKHVLSGKPIFGEDDPSFENMIRMIEDA